MLQNKAEDIQSLIPNEPSNKNYFLNRGFSDLKATIKESFQANKKTTNKAFASITNSNLSGLRKKAMGILFFFEALAVGFFGTLLTLLASILHSIIIIIIMIIIYMVLGVSKLLDGVYRRTLGLSVVCDRCKIKTELPGYKCPICKKSHYRLSPNVYGIITHTCTCGQKLPATFFIKTKNKLTSETYRRRNLDAVCANPNCKAQVFSGESRPLSITIAGSPSVGKTAYLTAVSHEFIERILPEGGCVVSHYTPEKEQMYLSASQDYEIGETTKTIEPSDHEEPSAFSLSFFVDHPKLKPRRLIHIFDIAGETFMRNAEHERQLQYSYAGIILIVDPMAIPEVRDQNEQKLDKLDVLSISPEDPNQVLSSFVAKVQDSGIITTGKRAIVPVAIVINKIDQPGVSDTFSATAHEEFQKAHPNFKKSVIEDHMCREFLKNNRMGNFVTTIDINFKTVRYFACSAIGHTRGKGEYEPLGVFEPINWLIELTDKTMAHVMAKN